MSLQADIAPIKRLFYIAISFGDIFASETSHLQYERPLRGMGGWNDPTSVPPLEIVREALQRRDGMGIERPERHRGTACDVWWQNAEINIKIVHGHPSFTPLRDQYKNPKVWWSQDFITPLSQNPNIKRQKVWEMLTFTNAPVKMRTKNIDWFLSKT